MAPLERPAFLEERPSDEVRLSVAITAEELVDDAVEAVVESVDHGNEFALVEGLRDATTEEVDMDDEDDERLEIRASAALLPHVTPTHFNCFDKSSDAFVMH